MEGFCVFLAGVIRGKKMKRKKRSQKRLSEIFKDVKYEKKKETVPDWLKRNLDEKIKEKSAK